MEESSNICEYIPPEIHLMISCYLDIRDLYQLCLSSNQFKVLYGKAFEDLVKFTKGGLIEGKNLEQRYRITGNGIILINDREDILGLIKIKLLQANILINSPIEPEKIRNSLLKKDVCFYEANRGDMSLEETDYALFAIVAMAIGQIKTYRHNHSIKVNVVCPKLRSNCKERSLFTLIFLNNNIIGPEEKEFNFGGVKIEDWERIGGISNESRHKYFHISDAVLGLMLDDEEKNKKYLICNQAEYGFIILSHVLRNHTYLPSSSVSSIDRYRVDDLERLYTKVSKSRYDTGLLTDPVKSYSTIISDTNIRKDFKSVQHLPKNCIKYTASVSIDNPYGKLIVYRGQYHFEEKEDRIKTSGDLKRLMHSYIDKMTRQNESNKKSKHIAIDLSTIDVNKLIQSKKRSNGKNYSSAEIKHISRGCGINPRGKKKSELVDLILQYLKDNNVRQ